MGFGGLGSLGRGFGRMGTPLGTANKLSPDPSVLFSQGQLGAWWDFSSTGTDKGFTTATGGSVISNGATVGLWIGQRFTGALASAMASQTNLVTAAGWSMSISGGTATATNSPSGTLNLKGDGSGNKGIADQSFASAAGKVYEIAFTCGTASARMSVGTTQGGTDILSGQLEPLGANKVYVTATGSTTWVQFYKDTATQITVSGITIKEVPGRIAVQGTSGLRPTYRTASLGYVDFDGLDDVLSAGFPASFTGDVVWLKADGTVSQSLGQSITTSYNLPTDDMKHCIIRQTLTASELSALRAWMLAQPFA